MILFRHIFLSLIFWKILMPLAHVFHVNKSTDVLSKHFSDNDLSFSLRQLLNKSITFLLQEMHICQDNFLFSVFKIMFWHAIIFSEPIYAFNSVFANYLPFMALYFLCYRTFMLNKFYVVQKQPWNFSNVYKKWNSLIWYKFQIGRT